MRTWLANAWSLSCRLTKFGVAATVFTLLTAASALAQEAAGEAGLKPPDLSEVTFLGIDICVCGVIFGLAIYTRLKNLPVHKSMRDISELIYEYCKPYLITQGKF